MPYPVDQFPRRLCTEHDHKPCDTWSKVVGAFYTLLLVPGPRLQSLGNFAFLLPRLLHHKVG